MSVIDRIVNLFIVAGQGAYFGETVSETEHALQTAHLAATSGAAGSLIAAALLHDIGHLLHGLPENIAEQGVDAHHENRGATWLNAHFGPAVADPVRLHVAAKRYLCTVDPTYHEGLSPASQLSLRLQGGPLSSDELQRFEREPHRSDAVALRRWDDAAKVAGLVVPGLEHYRPCLEAALLKRTNG